LPGATRLGVLINPGDATRAGIVAKETETAARSLGLKVLILNAGTSEEIDSAFAAFARERVDALFVAPDPFFNARRVQFAITATRYGIPANYAAPDYVEAGGLMSYGTDILEMYRQVGVYTGRILKGAKPADLPVVQSTKFELVINRQAAKAIGLELPATLLAIADEVID
jgi:putative ABC transport system substrate-binding protein